MRLRAAAAAACLVGAGIAAYLTYVHYAGIAPVCTTGGCEKVQTSKYAELAGVPVALLGLVTYAVLFVLALVRGVQAATLGVFVAVVGVAFSGYLLWAQLGPIDAICQWCLGNDLTITVVAALYVVRMLTESPTQKRRPG
ncbi:MAG TPA: vitamin K epoxide reductase family protein [Gaiellaceae bacterium]|nr:vitamin K epoxide reductase family protein [Gaiellaceae bacterium]